MPKIVYDIEFKVKGGKSISDSIKAVDDSGLKDVEKQASKTNQAIFTVAEQAENVGTSLKQSSVDGVKALNAVKSASKQLEQQQKRTNQTTKSTSKITSGANQVFFSFSDGIQDAAQFQFGFAQGMRAIGNNVSFTAELLAQLNKNAKASSITLGQALRQSLGGVGGALLALNLVISASTILMGAFGDKLFKAKEETDEFKEAVQDLSKELEDFDDLIQQISEKGLDPVVSDLNREKRLLGLAKRREQSIQDELDLAKARKKVAEDEFEALKETGKVVLFTTDEFRERKRATEEVERLGEELSKAKATTEQIRLEFISIGDNATRALEIVRENFVEGIGTAELTGNVTPSLLGDQDVSLELRQKTLRELQQELAQEEQALLETRTRAEAEAAQKSINLKKQEINTRLGLEKNATDQQKANFAALAQVATTIAQGLFSNDKAAAIATATVQGALAVQRALASAPPPINYALAAGVVAATAKQIKTIRSTEIGGGSSGGGGGGGGGSASSGRAGQSSGGSGFSIERSDAQSPTFTPSSNTLNAQPTVIVEQKVKNKELAILVKSGNQQIKSRRVGV